MTTTNEAAALAPLTDAVSVTIDGLEITVPKGTLVIRAAELLGIQIPRFCDHPLLDPVGACRQCLVEVQGQVKPLASCTTVCTDGMVVHTKLTSAVAEKAQRGVMELLLVNHPLDCPMCDKGGECPLQNQAMSTGRGGGRSAARSRRRSARRRSASRPGRTGGSGTGSWPPSARRPGRSAPCCRRSRTRTARPRRPRPAPARPARTAR